MTGLDINDHIDSPLNLKVSFNKLLEAYEQMAQSSNSVEAAHAARVLQIAEEHPILRRDSRNSPILRSTTQKLKKF